MKKIKTPLLIIVILLAAFFRFYQIDTNPKAMYGDGITLVYDAYSLYKTGHDQKGNPFPIVFSLGGGRPGGYVYATVPFAALLGPTALASIMVSVLSGVGIVLLLYFLGRELFSEGIGLAMAAVAALNPWNLSLSRGPFETHFALFLALGGVYCFIRGLKNEHWFIFSGLSFGLAIQTYFTFALTVPLILVVLLLWSRKFYSLKIRRSVLIALLALVATSLILTVYMMVSRGREDRFGIINAFTNPELRGAISTKVKSDRLLDSLPAPISNALHMPQTELIATLAQNYFANFSSSFLFLNGDGQPRHNPAGMGEFFWVDVVLMVFGIVYLFKRKRPVLILLSAWVLIAPISTSLVGSAHALRSSFLLPPLVILIGIGLWRLLTTSSQRLNLAVLISLAIIFLIQFIYFFDKFYFVAPQKHARLWSYPAKEASFLAERNRSKFDLVILSNDIDNMEFAYPAYMRLDPNLVIEQNQNPAKIGEYSFFKYGNVYIGSLPNSRLKQFIQDLPGSVLYIGAPKQEPYMENYKIIRGFDSEPDLVITAKGGIADLNLPYL